MSEKLKPINTGDHVSVSFHGQAFTLIKAGVVVYMPTAPGDSWVIRNSEDGSLHYISEGCTISKYVEGVTP